MLRTAACSLIHADDVETGLVGFGSDAMHIMRIGTAFKPMQQQHRLSGAPILLPMAPTHELSVGVGTKDPPFNRDPS
jgi:hypothetical protein